MVRILLQILASVTVTFAAYAIWRDLSTPFSASMPFGKIWYDLHPSSLQITESIVSRYIDPCGLITSLNCTPYLWHPLIATFLGWPAGLVSVCLAGLFWFLASRNSSKRRTFKKSS